MAILKRKLGKTGEEVTIFGLGGEGILRTYGYDDEAYKLINRALDLGVNYRESARAYSGSESYYGHALGNRRKDVFLASKAHERSKSAVLAQLQETLAAMHTDYLDLWQVHDVRGDSDIQTIFGKNGAIEAFDTAKREGRVRFIGITGHHDPDILAKCLDLYDFDTVLMPINPAETFYNSFIDKVLPVAIKKEVGVIAMKIYFRGFATKLPLYTSMKPFFRYAMSYGTSTAVIGCDNIEHLEQNASYAGDFTPLTDDEKENLERLTSPYARQLMYYKP